MYKIIIADDEPVMRRALMTLVDWKEMDCEVAATCSDGDEAEQALRLFHPDILISDIKMPGKSGLQLAELVEKHAMHTKVILLTAFADFALAQQAIRFGVIEYVTKTGSMEDIVTAVKKCKERLAAELGGVKPADRSESFFRSVLDGSLYRPDLLYAEAACCGLNLDKFMVLGIELSSASGQTVEKASKLLQSEFPQALLLPMGPCRAYLVLCDTPNEIKRRCIQLADTFYTLTQQMLYLSISDAGKGAEKLRECFIQADTALSQMFFYPQQAVHSYQPTAQHGNEATRDISALLTRFAEDVERGNERSAADLLEGLFVMQSSGGSPDQIRSEGLLLLNLCRAQLDHAGILQESIEELSLWRERLLKIHSFSEYKILMHSLLNESCRAVARRLQTGGNVVEDARRYIEKNYHRPITLSEIAAAINVNPSYLSRVFKSKTGLNLVDTINRKRMERAKELLKTYTMKVYEVATAVGVEDTTYFSHLFRKYAGMSPRDYQDQYARGRQEDNETTTEDNL